MKNNLFKGFIPFIYTEPTTWTISSAHCWARDPKEREWRTMGISKTHIFVDESEIVELGPGRVLFVQINERILPGKVRDEELKKKIDQFIKNEDREPKPAEYAEMRDQVEADMLPRAFIRRTLIPVIFCKANSSRKLMLVCTSSHKRADDIALLLEVAFLVTGGFKCYKAETNNNPGSVLTRLAIDREYALDESCFDPGTSAILKHDDEKVTINEKSIECKPIKALLDDEFEVQQLGITWSDNDENTIEFVVNTSLIFKKLMLPMEVLKEVGQDKFAYAEAFARWSRQLFKDFATMCGGLKPPPTAKKAPGTEGL